MRTVTMAEFATTFVSRNTQCAWRLAPLRVVGGCKEDVQSLKMGCTFRLRAFTKRLCTHQITSADLL
jgi:hypothetical protein